MFFYNVSMHCLLQIQCMLLFKQISFFIMFLKLISSDKAQVRRFKGEKRMKLFEKHIYRSHS